MAKKLTTSDIYDIDRKTGALILGKNRLDEYARKYLSSRCQEALTEPMPLPVDKILQDEKLTVKEVQLSRNHDIFGCCLLLDGEVEIYDSDIKGYRGVHYPAGTVLIDPYMGDIFGEGVRRNTLIHEALHWEKDKRYFEILEVKNAAISEKLSPIMCRQTTTFYEPPEGKKTKENQVKWLEWQANRLAPRVLMPRDAFKKKALELLEAHTKDGEALCDNLIEELSDFFIVSRESAKYRLLEVGLEEKLKKLADYEDLYAGINARKEYVKLSAADAFQMLCENPLLQEWVLSGRFLFVEGYFVLADRNYITSKNSELRLTAKARKNLQQCAINIHEQKYVAYQNLAKDLVGYVTLFKVADLDQRLLLFHPKFQTNFKYEPEEVYQAFCNAITAYDEEEEIELIKMLGDPTTTLCQCLWFLMENRNWQYPELFHQKTNLHRNYLGKIKNNSYNNMGTETLMAICVGLKLNFRITEKIFGKSKNKLDHYHDPDKTYIRILEMMPGLSLFDFNSVLEVAGLSPLGTEDREYY